MKRISTIVLTLFIGLCAFAATAPTASSILSRLHKNMLARPAVEAKFTINGGQGPVQGSITMAGARFTMITPQLKVWYDGKTQWTYLASTGEVSITEPTASELAASNPFAILNSFETEYKSRRLADIQGRKRVELIPRAKDMGIEKIEIVADKEEKWPQSITITFDDRRQINLVLDHVVGIDAPSAKTFVYDAKLQPATEVIDLR